MQHTIYINVDPGPYNWGIVGSLNNEPGQLSNNQLIFRSDLREKNLLEIKFSGKNPLKFPDMCVKIQSMIFDYIDITPVLWSATHHTQHPDWRFISPCTDINIDGTWVLKFSDSIVKDTIKTYLGVTSE